MSKSERRREPIPMGGAWTAEERQRARRELSVEIRVRGELRGAIELRDGRAVGSTESVRRLMESATVVEPETLAILSPSDGARYLRAVPFTLSGTYVSARRTGER